jgi:3-oxocholest-4-en-26-oate---CoA ligase
VLDRDTKVITDDGRFVEPGSGEQGMLARRGRTSLGYYKDEAKTDATFRVVDGERWLVPGDAATVEADGTITLLGRGSVSINTGGEKVFPQEVEDVVTAHPAVRDALVVGVPDDRFGEAVVAVVELEGEASEIDAEAIRAYARERLAGYKVPRQVLVVPSLERQVTGKPDYQRWKRDATAMLGLTPR